MWLWLCFEHWTGNANRTPKRLKLEIMGGSKTVKRNWYSYQWHLMEKHNKNWKAKDVDTDGLFQGFVIFFQLLSKLLQVYSFSIYIHFFLSLSVILKTLKEARKAHREYRKGFPQVFQYQLQHASLQWEFYCRFLWNLSSTTTGSLKFLPYTVMYDEMNLNKSIQSHTCGKIFHQA